MCDVCVCVCSVTVAVCLWHSAHWCRQFFFCFFFYQWSWDVFSSALRSQMAKSINSSSENHSADAQMDLFQATEQQSKCLHETLSLPHSPAMALLDFTRSLRLTPHLSEWMQTNSHTENHWRCSDSASVTAAPAVSSHCLPCLCLLNQNMAHRCDSYLKGYFLLYCVVFYYQSSKRFVIKMIRWTISEDNVGFRIYFNVLIYNWSHVISF